MRKGSKKYFHNDKKWLHRNNLTKQKKQNDALFILWFKERKQLRDMIRKARVIVIFRNEKDTTMNLQKRNKEMKFHVKPNSLLKEKGINNEKENI